MLHNLDEFLSVSLLFFTLCFAGAIALLTIRKLLNRKAVRLETLGFFGIYISAALATWLLTHHTWEVLFSVAFGLVTFVAASRLLRNFTISGRLLLVTNAQLLLFSLLWGTWFIATIPISTTTRALIFAGYPFLILALPVGIVQTFEQWEVLCRRTWLRPRRPLLAAPRAYYPKVSLHVPAYAEPPEIVIATLDTLSRLRYPNFEVLVIDNNTPDPNLWKPVQAHCRKLGDRFRFFHVDRLPGAKAGALNFALRHTAEDAELVAVVDSDYQVKPDFLEALVGYFDDPKMGFVQTPHDYREWEGSLYQRICYWEYNIFFKTMLVSRNERVAALTVGTMCLIRRKALEEAGGWAEWCVTEDSELAVRIHALGYSSVYLNTTFGRGLIPETFAGYKKQRFRWTYGPVQELKHHFRLFLPSPLGRPSALSLAQKIHHLNHGLDRLTVGLGFLLIPLSTAIAISMLLHQEVIPVPRELWLAATVTLVANWVIPWLIYRAVLRCSLRDTLGALVASNALNHVVTMASLWAIFTHRIPWRRTNKFKALPKGLVALSSAQAELLLGLTTLLFIAGAYVIFAPQGFLLMLMIGAFFQSLRYLTAPVLALLAEWDVQSQHASSSKSFKRLVGSSKPEIE